jgi:antitoxin MazE
MRTHVRKVGNSRGIIIPTVLLEACEFGDEVDLRVEGKALVIEALKTYRAGWFDSYQPEEANEDALAALPVDEISEEWEW